jgi:hypothetical protein
MVYGQCSQHRREVRDTTIYVTMYVAIQAPPCFFFHMASVCMQAHNNAHVLGKRIMYAASRCYCALTEWYRYIEHGYACHVIVGHDHE